MQVEVRAGAAVADAIARAFAQFRPPPRPDRTGPIAALREIARRLEAGAPLDAEQADWLAAGLRRYLDAGGELTLDAALFRRSPGGVSPWRAERLAQRNAALRRLAAEHFAGRPITAQAAAILAAARRYQASGWRFDRDREAPPAGEGDPRELLWRALKAAPLPEDRRQLVRILSGAGRRVTFIARLNVTSRVQPSPPCTQTHRLT